MADLMGGNQPTAGVGAEWALSSILTQGIIRFYNYMILCILSVVCRRTVIVLVKCSVARCHIVAKTSTFHVCVLLWNLETKPNILLCS